MAYMINYVEACGPVDRALDSRSEGLGFDSQCWPCGKVSGKLPIPHYLGPQSRNGYLVHRSKSGSIVAGCIGAHLARRKVKSVEHTLSWSLVSKQLPLPLCAPLTVHLPCSPIISCMNTASLDSSLFPWLFVLAVISPELRTSCI